MWLLGFSPGALSNVEYPFIAIASRSSLTWIVVPVRVAFMDRIELFKNLTVCKQMTDVKLNCECYITMLETLYLCAKMESLILHRNIGYNLTLEMNELCWIELNHRCSCLFWKCYLQTLLTNNTGQQQICCLRFLADLGRIWCTESQNYNGFAQSG